jgi:hypothetical protein
MVTVDAWEDPLNPTLEFRFIGVEAYAKVGVHALANRWFSINLHTSETPIGVEIPGLMVGIVFSVDLVFSFSAEIDVTGGLWVRIPDDAYIQAGLFEGDIQNTVL